MKEILKKVRNLFSRTEEVAPAAVQTEEPYFYELEDGYRCYIVEPDWPEEEQRELAEHDRTWAIERGEWGLCGTFSICGTFRDLLEKKQREKEWKAELEAEAESERQHVIALNKRIAELEKGDLTGDAYREWDRLIRELCAWE